MRTTVGNVMTTDVVSVNQNANFHVVADLIIKRAVSGLPVLDDDGHVVGVVTEADLLAKEEFKQQYYGDDYHPPLRSRIRRSFGSEGTGRAKARGETAGELMTAPAYVTTPGTRVVEAARRMDRHGVKRLPVVDAEGKLVGIVSRRDLLKVFLRLDADIRDQLLETIPRYAVWADPARLGVQVNEGVITLSGRVDRHSEAIALAGMAENLDGVVAVRQQLTWEHDDVADTPA